MAHRIVGLLALALLIGGCGREGSAAPPDVEPASGNRSVEYDSAAAWMLDPAFPPPEASQSKVHVLVTGLACSGGAERKLEPPRIQSDEKAVTVTFTVEPLPVGNYTCPGGPGQPYAVDLVEPLGERQLVDGLCLGSGPLVETVYCESDGGIRWPR
jgi:hypothetical protein